MAYFFGYLKPLLKRFFPKKVGGYAPNSPELAIEIINHIWKEGTSIFFITHDIDEALLLGDRVLVLHDGAIHQYDTPEELIKNPATDFVLSLLGHRYSNK